MHEIAMQTGKPVIADSLLTAQTSNLQCSGTVVQALNTIGQAFDCRWRVTGTGVVLLEQGFHQRNLLPQTNVAELHAYLQDILEAIHAFQPLQPNDVNITPQLTSLAGILSSEQISG